MHRNSVGQGSACASNRQRYEQGQATVGARAYHLTRSLLSSIQWISRKIYQVADWKAVDGCIYRKTRPVQKHLWGAGKRVTWGKQNHLHSTSISKFRGFLTNSSWDKLQIAKPRKSARGGRSPLGRPVLTLQETTDQLISQPWIKEQFRAWKTNFSDTFRQPTVLPEERPQSGTRLKTTTFNSTVQLSDTGASRTTVLSSSGHITLVQHKYYYKKGSKLPELSAEDFFTGTCKTTEDIHISITFSGTLQASAIQGSVLLWIQWSRLKTVPEDSARSLGLQWSLQLEKTVCQSYQLWTLNCLKIELKYGG